VYERNGNTFWIGQLRSKRLHSKRYGLIKTRAMPEYLDAPWSGAAYYISLYPDIYLSGGAWYTPLPSKSPFFFDDKKCTSVP
jgi:hypothetical protein